MMRYFIFLLLFLTTSMHSQDKKLELLRKYNNSEIEEKILLLKMLIHISGSTDKKEIELLSIKVKQAEEEIKKLQKNIQDRIEKTLESHNKKINQINEATQKHIGLQKNNQFEIEELKKTQQKRIKELYEYIRKLQNLFYTIDKQASNNVKIKSRSKNDRFLVYENEVIKDTLTTLEWYIGHDQDTNYEEAKDFVKNLAVAGGQWRLPTINELQEIYKENKDQEFLPTDYIIWSTRINSKNGIAEGFTFYSDRRFGKVNWVPFKYGNNCRVLAVRSEKR